VWDFAFPYYLEPFLLLISFYLFLLVFLPSTLIMGCFRIYSIFFIHFRLAFLSGGSELHPPPSPCFCFSSSFCSPVYDFLLSIRVFVSLGSYKFCVLPQFVFLVQFSWKSRWCLLISPQLFITFQWTKYIFPRIYRQFLPRFWCWSLRLFDFLTVFSWMWIGAEWYLGLFFVY